MNGQEIITLNQGGLSLAFASDAKTLVATNGSELTVWDVSAGVPLYSIPAQATSLDLAPTGDLLAYTNGIEIVLWDLLA